MFPFMLLSLYPVCAQPAKPVSDPCALVTKAEMQEAIGKPVTATQINSINKAVCDFTIGQLGAAANVMLVNKAPGDSPEKVVAEMRKRKKEAETVSGLGDGAYIADGGYGMRVLGVYKGSKHALVTLLLPGVPVPKVKAIAEQVIRKALARL